MELILSTRNPKKVEELGEVLGTLGHDLISLEVFEKKQGISLPEVEEVADTFYGNALLKAEALYQYCCDLNLGVIADDSGLIVPLLNGEPGVHSARYAEDEIEEGLSVPSIHRANIDKLHRKLRNHPRYSGTTPAYFQTVIVLLFPKLSSTARDPRIVVGEGRCEGLIIDDLRGNQGFGYDPIFIPEENNPEQQTFAEMEPESKNAISHRSRAIRMVLDNLAKWNR